MDVKYHGEILLSFDSTISGQIGYCKSLSENTKQIILELSNIDEFNSVECAFIIKYCITNKMELQNINKIKDTNLLDKLFEFITFLSLDIKLLLGILKFGYDTKSYIHNSKYFNDNILKFVLVNAYEEGKKYIENYKTYKIENKELFEIVNIDDDEIFGRNNLILYSHIHDLNLPRFVFNDLNMIERIDYIKQLQNIKMFHDNNITLLYDMDNIDNNSYNELLIVLPELIFYDNDIFYDNNIDETYFIKNSSNKKKYETHNCNNFIDVKLKHNKIILYYNNEKIIDIPYKIVDDEVLIPDF